MMNYSRKKQIILFSYVIIITTIIIGMNWRYDNLLYADYRTELLRKLLNQIENGIVPDFLGQSIHSWGFTLYLPYLAYFTGVQDINYLFFILQMISGWFVLVFFTTEVYVLTRNVFVTAVTPILCHVFCGNILYGFKTQTFWTAAPVVILGIPLLYMVFMAKTHKRRIGLIVLLGLLCSWANVMRNQTAFPIAVAALVIFLCLFWQEKSEIGLLKSFLFLIAQALLFYILYYLICTYIPYMLGKVTGSSIINNEGFVWHSFLCGLGVYENPYGLAWNDGVISEIIKERYGYAAYSNEYLNACKDYFFFIVKDNPVFVFSTWIKKFFSCMQWALQILFYPMNILVKVHPYGEVYLFNSATWCIRNMSIPTILSALYVGISEKKYKRIKNKRYRKNIIFLLLFFFIIIITGTVQGVIGYPGYITYYMPTVSGLCALPLFLFLYYLYLQKGDNRGGEE